MRCSTCDAPLQEGKSRCVGCGAWHVSATSRSSGRRVRLRDVAADAVERVAAQAVGSRAMGGGYPRSCVTLLGGEPGTGKSTFALQLARHFDTCLYIASEESPPAIRERADRLGLIPGMLDTLEIVSTADGVWIDTALEGTPCALIILDSLPGLCGVGENIQAQVTLKALKKHAVTNHSCVLVTDHATKTDYFAGQLMLQHEVDTTLVMVAESATERRLVAVKNRHGASGAEELLDLGAHGLTTIPSKPKGIKSLRGA